MIGVILGLLLCVTLLMSTLSAVARTADGGSRVEWYHPDGTKIPPNTPDTDFYRTRYTQQVRLNHRNNAMSPIGVFTCEVPNDGDSTMPHTATITIGECNSLYDRTSIMAISEPVAAIIGWIGRRYSVACRIQCLLSNTHVQYSGLAYSYIKGVDN